MKFEMPMRLAEDGGMEVTRVGEHHIRVEVTTNGREEAITMSRFNAARVFGALALFLHIPLSKTVGKSITFGNKVPTEMSFGPDKVPETLGERVSASLLDDLMTKEAAKLGIDLVKVPKKAKKAKK